MITSYYTRFCLASRLSLFLHLLFYKQVSLHESYSLNKVNVSNNHMSKEIELSLVEPPDED